MVASTWVDSVSAGAGVVTGRIVRLDAAGSATVTIADGSPVPARRLESVSLNALRTALDNATDVVCLLEDGQAEKPIIIGIVASPHTTASETGDQMTATVDGERVVLTGKEEVVLKCGKASITLTRAGKILLRGTHLLSRSSGANRIKGGSVQIN